jgi:hypothetical protein
MNHPARVSTTSGSRWVCESHASPVLACGRLITDPPAAAGGTDFVLWLFVPRGKIATVALGAVGVDPVAFDHPVECASIDAEDLGGPCAVSAGDLEDIQQVTSFEFVEHRQIFEESRQW